MPVPKDALRELSGAGEAYRFLLSERDLAVIVLSENVEDCNEAACQLFGVTRDEFIGRSPLEFAPPFQPDGSPSETSARERLASALAGLPQWCTWQYRRKDGTPVDTIVHVEAVRVDGRRRVLIRIRDVSRLERAEVALAESETQMTQILGNTTTAIVFAKDLDGRYLFVNRAFERIVGLPQREIVGKTTQELFPAETAAELMGNDARVIAAGNTITVEENVSLGGRRRTLFTNKFPLFDSNGRPYAMCGIAADITERKRTEEAVRRAAVAVSVAAGEDVFRELVGALATILEVEIAFIALHKPGAHHMLKMLAFQVDGKWIEDFEYPIAGTPCEQVMGEQYRAFPSGLGEAFDLKDEFRRMGLQSYAGLHLTDALGESLGIMTVLSRRPLPDSDLVESMLRIFAARAVTEIERERANDALRESEEQYRAIFNGSVDALVLWNSSLQRVDVNPAYERLMDYSREEVLGGAYEASLTPQEAERRRQMARRSLAGESVQADIESVRKNGERVQIEVRTIPIQHLGEPHVLAVCRD
ncbi:MAG: PAS domain S-box protein, partial [Gammaproteobacteria bacterium]|nr:PAS domain S-box protein [Gammaproteobacteria bacterium]